MNINTQNWNRPWKSLNNSLHLKGEKLVLEDWLIQAWGTTFRFPEKTKKVTTTAICNLNVMKRDMLIPGVYWSVNLTERGMSTFIERSCHKKIQVVRDRGTHSWLASVLYMGTFPHPHAYTSTHLKISEKYGSMGWGLAKNSQWLDQGWKPSLLILKWVLFSASIE